VVTSTLVMEGDGRVGDYVGGYTDWLRQRADTGAAKAFTREAAKAPVAAKRKLSFKESRELESLPALIEALEAEVESLTAALSDPSFYSRDASVITAHNAKIADAQARLDAAYSRWSELDG
jgi:ATP-binding cassette subfamily F protein uup